MKLFRNVFLLSVLVILLLTGCYPVRDIVSLTPTSSTDTIVVASPFPTIRKQAVIPSVVSKISSETPYSEKATSSKTPESTLTFVPALSSIEAENRVIKQLKDNGGCHLPCFWGFVPGKSDIQMVQSVLYAYKNIRHNVLFSEMGGGMDLRFQKDNTIFNTNLIVEGDRAKQSAIIKWIDVEMTASLEQHGESTPIYNDPFYTQYFQYYSISSLLSKYGPPEKVYVGIELNAQMGGTNQYYLYLDYTKSGWAALITMAANWKKDDIFEGCPNRGFTSLRLWGPGDNNVPKYNMTPFSLEEATTMNLDSFYKQFKAPTSYCLETRVSKLTFPK